MKQVLLQKKQGQTRSAQRQAKAVDVSRGSQVGLLRLQQTVGNHGVLRRLPGVIQTKLTISQPGDQYEQEADRVAEAVMRMPESEEMPLEGEEEDERIQMKPLAEQITPLVQREVEEAEEIEEDEVSEGLVQPKRGSGQVPELTPEVKFRIHALRGGGQPLLESTRAFFEPRFGCDFSRVRVHSEPVLAHQLNARAFTVKQNIVFGTSQYSPDTKAGQTLIAHELGHVIQQRGVTASATDKTAFLKLGRSDPAEFMLQRQPLIRRTPDPRSLREVIIVHSLSPAQILTEINLINEWIRNNPRNSINESAHLILEAALERLRRPISPPMGRSFSGLRGTFRATSRAVRDISSSLEPPVLRGSLKTPGLRVPQGPEGRAAERAAEIAAHLPETFEHMERAFAVSEAAGRVIRTVSSDAVQLQVPIERVSPERVQELAQEMGYRMHRGLARHAELRQAAAPHPDRPIGVSRPQCGSCFAFFVRLARHRLRTQIVNDTVATRYFLPNGEVIEVWNDGTQVRLNMSSDGRRVLSGATVIPPQAGGTSIPSGGSAAQRTPSRASSVPAPSKIRTIRISTSSLKATAEQAEQLSRPTYTRGQRVATGVVGGTANAIAIANEMLGKAVYFKKTLPALFKKYQSDLFGNMGGKEKWDRSYQHPSNERLRTWLKRFTSWGEFREFIFGTASPAGLRVYNDKYAFMLDPKTPWFVENEFKEVMDDLLEKEGQKIQKRKQTGAIQMRFKPTVAVSKRQIWPTEAGVLRALLTPLVEGEDIPANARFFFVRVKPTIRGGIIVRPYVEVEGADLETLQALKGKPGLIRIDRVEFVQEK